MKIEGIQVLRALAAYLVLFFHIRGHELLQASKAGSEQTALMGDVFSRGFVGVDLFFVISGFIMAYVTHNLPRGLTTVKSFALGRIFRIYPVWWLFAGILAVLSLMMAGTLWHPDSFYASQGNGYVFMLKSFLLIPQDVLPSLNVGWTLIHEMGFYLVFAVFLLFPRQFLPIFLFIWLALLILAKVYGVPAQTSNSFVKIAASPLSIEFIFGAFAGYLYASGFRKFRWAAFMIGVVSSIAVFNLMPAEQLSRFKEVCWMTLPFTLLVYGSTALDDAFAGSTAFRGAKQLGDWSYSIYLCHPIVLLVLNPVIRIAADTLQWEVLHLGTPGIWDNVLFNLAGVLGTTLLAGLTFYLFEKPVLKILNQTFRKPGPETKKARLSETAAL